MMKPMAKKITPAISQPVPKSGCINFRTAGELSIVTGRETNQTQITVQEISWVLEFTDRLY